MPYSESGPWKIIHGPARPDINTVTHHEKRRDRWATPFYRVDLIDTKSSQVYPSEVVFPRHPPDEIATRLHNRLVSLLKENYGVEVWFLKKRIEGEEDREAFNPGLHRLTGQSGESYGKRFKGGYYAPIAMYAKLNPDARVIQHLPVGTIGDNQTSCWIAGRPFLSPGVLFVERWTNRRWRVGKQVQRQDWRQTIWRQFFTIEEIPIASPEYDIPIGEAVEEIGRLLRLESPKDP